jgi:hypothetical protein
MSRHDEIAYHLKLEQRAAARERRRSAAERERREKLKLHSKGLLDVDAQRSLWPSQGSSYGSVE